jgi:hypothetical protein
MKTNQQHLEQLRQGGAVLNFASLTEALINDEQLSTMKSRLGLRRQEAAV